MPTDTSVKFFHSGMSGAPTLNGVAGSLIALLDACLVSGWGSQSVDSITISGGVGTVTRGAGITYEVDQVVELAGATVTGGTINGHQKVLSVDATSWTFDATGIANQTASGSITQKVAAVGWSKPYTGTNLAVFRSADVTGTRFYLRVDDTNANNARVVGYEAMTDVNTGTGPFPTTSQSSGGLWWAKANTTSPANPRQYVLWGNTKFFFMAVNWDNVAAPTNYSLECAFGDWNRAGSNDAYACGVFGSTTSVISSSGPGNVGVDYELSSETSSVTSASLFAARPYSGLGSSQPLTRGFGSLGAVKASACYSGGLGNGQGQFPNPSDGGLYVSEVMLSTSAASGAGVYRGKIPGLYACPQVVGGQVFAHRAKIENVANLSGRKLMAVNSSNGVSFVDITGPW